MRIAVTTIFLQKNSLEGYGHYTQEVLQRMVQQHPEHEFLFVFDRQYDEKFLYAPNVKAVVVSPPARQPLGFKYWYDVAVPRALRSFAPDVWLQPYGFCSLSTRIPQVLIVHDLAFIHFPKFIPWYHRLYYKLFTKKFLRKANHVITVSHFCKGDIILQYGILPGKISVAPGAAREGFRYLSWFEREDVKEAFADGKEYFLFMGGMNPRKNLMTALKAFSLFKKWQQSNMKLLIAGRLHGDAEGVLSKLDTYRYRDDVVLLDYQPEDELERIVSAAYALLYPSFFEGFGLPILEAMQCEVPVITGDSSAMPETGGDAALYATASDHDAVAKHMINVYRNEALRAELILKGKAQAAKYSWNTTTGLIWEKIVSVAANKQLK